MLKAALFYVCKEKIELNNLSQIVKSITKNEIEPTGNISDTLSHNIDTTSMDSRNKITESDFKEEKFLQKLTWLRRYVIYQFVGYGINLIINLRRKNDRLSAGVTYSHWII